MRDEEWQSINGFYFDDYAFSERVGIILEDNAINPSQKELQAARLQAAKELGIG